jgi:hypothetical protein
MFTDDELTKRAAYSLLRAPGLKQIEFAASVVYKESDRDYSKRRYYSVSELKLTSAKAKQHDKRYEEVSSWNTGEPGAIYRMLLPTYSHGLEMYLYADAIRTWTHDQPRLYMALTAEFLNWFAGDRDKAQQLRHAFSACTALARAYQLRCEAQNELDSIRRPQATVPTEEPAATPDQIAEDITRDESPTKLDADREVGETEPAIAA